MRQRDQLAAFIAAKRRTRKAKHSTPALDTPGPQRHFTPARHGLTAEQCRMANRLLRQAEAQRPLRGTIQQQRFQHALRCAGILSAVKRGLVGSRRFGRRLQGHHGGNTVRDHALSHLRQWAPVASLAARMAREKRTAQEVWERTGEVLPIGTAPMEILEQARIRSLQEQWESQQWQTQQAEHLKW